VGKEMMETRGVEQNEAADEQKEEVRHKETPSDRRWAIILAIYSGIVLVIVIYHMINFWPLFAQLTTNMTITTTNNTITTTTPINQTVTERIRILPYLDLWFPMTKFTADNVLMIGMMIAGMMGACVFSLWAISHHTGNQKDFDASWKYWYILRPPLGAGLAFILYILLRAGILSFGANLSNLNASGLVGISGLCGMFVEHAMHKLLELADTLFKPPPPPSEAAVPPSFSAVNEKITQAVESYEKEQYKSSFDKLSELEQLLPKLKEEVRKKQQEQEEAARKLKT